MRILDEDVLSAQPSLSKHCIFYYQKKHVYSTSHCLLIFTLHKKTQLRFRRSPHKIAINSADLSPWPWCYQYLQLFIPLLPLSCSFCKIKIRTRRRSAVFSSKECVVIAPGVRETVIQQKQQEDENTECSNCKPHYHVNIVSLDKTVDFIFLLAMPITNMAFSLSSPH